MELMVDGEMGETFWCRKCGLEVSVDFDKNTIEVDAEGQAKEGAS